MVTIPLRGEDLADWITLYSSHHKIQPNQQWIGCKGSKGRYFQWEENKGKGDIISLRHIKTVREIGFKYCKQDLVFMNRKWRTGPEQLLQVYYLLVSK